MIMEIETLNSVSAFFVTPLLLAVIGFVYCVILVAPDQLLNGWYNWLYDLFKVTNRLEEGKPRPGLFKILVGCEKCFTGQFCAWFFLFQNIGLYGDVIRFHIGALFGLMIVHAAFVSLGIYYVTILNSFYNKLK